jgi:hypothetical protein
MDDLLTGCPSGDLVQGPLSRAVASRNIHQHWSRNLRGWWQPSMKGVRFTSHSLWLEYLAATECESIR